MIYVGIDFIIEEFGLFKQKLYIYYENRSIHLKVDLFNREIRFFRKELFFLLFLCGKSDMRNKCKPHQYQINPPPPRNKRPRVF
jgi:hypothetical protein